RRRGLDDGAGLGELRERHALQLDHRGDRFRDAVDVGFRDERAAGRADLHADEAAGLEDAERVAHGDARDAELLRELALGLEAVARVQLSREDRALDLGHDLARRAGLVDGGEHDAANGMTIEAAGTTGLPAASDRAYRLEAPASCSGISIGTLGSFWYSEKLLPSVSVQPANQPIAGIGCFSSAFPPSSRTLRMVASMSSVSK